MVVCFCFTIASANIHAEELTTSLANSKTNANFQSESQHIQQSSSLELELIKPAKKEFKGMLRVEGMQYQTSMPDKPKLNSNLLLSSSFHFRYENNFSQSGVDLSLGRDLDLQRSEFILRELFTAIPLANETSYLSVGRKLEYWSEVDNNWNLGLWQPYTYIDALRPQRQGLLGAFLRLQNTWFDFLAYATPYFIPTMGPEIREKDGSLESDSRWFRSPSSSFPLNGKETRLVYSLDVPDIAKLVENPGRGFRLRLGEKQGFWMSTSYGYKPMNSLALKYKSRLFLPEKDPNTGQVTMQPAVLYHEVMGTDFGYQNDGFEFSLSYLHDKPYPKTAEEGWVMQSPEGLSANAAHFSFESKDLLPNGLLQSWSWLSDIELALDYLQVSGGRIHDFDSAGQESGAIFEERLNFTNAAQVQVIKSLWLLGQPVKGQVKYLREFAQKGSLWGMELQFYPKPKWALVMGADILGVDDDRNENTDSRFLNQFRANDRYYAGLSYVF